MVIVAFEVVCLVLFYLHDREKQAGELELFSNFGRSVDCVFEAWYLVLFIFDQSRH